MIRQPGARLLMPGFEQHTAPPPHVEGILALEVVPDPKSNLFFVDVVEGVLVAFSLVVMRSETQQMPVSLAWLMA